MKKRTAIYLIFALVGILPYIGAATPGIIITLDPLSKSTQSGTAVDYQVIIINDDGILDVDGNCIDECWDKTITSLSMIETQPGWDYVIDSLVTNHIPPGKGNRITTTLHITPLGATPDTYNHKIEVISDSTLYDQDGNAVVSLSGDSDYEEFATIIEGTPIPEFPTIALPIVSVLGLMLLISRRKSR